jgi:hypothetical protein
LVNNPVHAGAISIMDATKREAVGPDNYVLNLANSLADLMSLYIGDRLLQLIRQGIVVSGRIKV